MYNYMEAEKDEIREYIADKEYYLSGLTRDEMEEKLNEWLWRDGDVTEFATKEEAKECFLADGFEYLRECAEEWGIAAETIGEKIIAGDYEYLDTTVREYLLSMCIAEVLDEYEEQGYFDELAA